MLAKLLTPIRLMRQDLPNRGVMTPKTRASAGAEGAASQMMAVHCAQRAFGGPLAGPIVSEERPVIADGGDGAAKAEAERVSGRADGVSFGLFFTAPPDLLRRLPLGATPATANRKTIYVGRPPAAFTIRRGKTPAERAVQRQSHQHKTGADLAH